MQMAHERLDVYQLALQVGRWTIQSRWPRGTADLKNQAIRAATSVALNIAEGSRRRGKAQTHHFEIARGSVAEALTALQLVDLAGGAQQQHNLRRIDRMLEKLGG
jgi:four helix bundle protein